MATVTSQSKGKIFEQINARIKELDGVTTQAGFLGGTYPNGRSIAENAIGNEFGIPSRGIPPRPFMRPAVTDNKQKWANLMASGARAVLKGNETPFSVMDKVGAVAASDIAQAIINVTAPPLSPITIDLRDMKRRGIKVTGATVGEAARKVASDGYVTPSISDKPLIEPGQDGGIMLAAVSHETKKG
jgi:hypothetical protein